MNSGTQPRWIPWARTGSCAAEHPLGQLIFTMIILVASPLYSGRVSTYARWWS